MLVGLIFMAGVAAIAAPVPALAAGAPGSSPWSWQNPLPVGNDLGDISCPTASVCYVGGVPGAVLVTNNGGASWFTRPVSPGVGAISCPTELVCFAGSSNNTLLHTIDGGGTWTRQTSPIQAAPPLIVAFGGISCPNVSTCFAVGSVGSMHPGPGFIIATTNAGTTWVEQTPSQIGPLGSVACPDATTCYASGSFGELMATKDGKTWSSQQTPVNDDLGQVSCHGLTFCVVAGPGNQVITTSDGGATWVAHATVATLSGALTGIACPTVSACIAVGMDNHTTADMIAVATSDGGSTWQTSYDPRIAGWLNRIACASAMTCVAVGNHGWIAATSNGGTTWFSPSSGISTPLHAVSCPSEQVCFAAGDAGTVLATTNGGGRWYPTTTGTAASLWGIGCASAAQCTAVGLGGTIIATSDGGVHWAAVASPTSQDLFGVSCPSATHCVAVGQYSTVLVIDNGVAQNIPNNNPYTVFGVSCPSTTNCFFVGSTESFSAFVQYGAIHSSADGGLTWTTQTSHDPNDLRAISCSAGTTVCSAVDTLGNMVSSADGVNWSMHAIHTTGYDFLRGVSCPAPGACIAVTDGGEIVSTPDGGITAQTQPPLTGRELFGASCPSVSVCTVVGDGGVILSSGRQVAAVRCVTNYRRGSLLCPAARYRLAPVPWYTGRFRAIPSHAPTPTYFPALRKPAQ